MQLCFMLMRHFIKNSTHYSKAKSKYYNILYIFTKSHSAGILKMGSRDLHRSVQYNQKAANVLFLVCFVFYELKKFNPNLEHTKTSQCRFNVLSVTLKRTN